MATVFELESGTCEVADNVDGWIITSDRAVAVDNEDMPLRKGDRIDINGRVFRNGELVGSL